MQTDTKYDIVPFRSVGPLVLGEARYRDLLIAFGVPEVDETAPLDDGLGTETGGNRVLCYATRGIGVVFAGPVVTPDDIIDGIYVEAPNLGLGPDGLHLGMRKEAAMKTLTSRYAISLKICEGEVIFFAEVPGGSSKFEVWFEGERLIRMKNFRE
jgi:hypothetical protein